MKGNGFGQMEIVGIRQDGQNLVLSSPMTVGLEPLCD